MQRVKAFSSSAQRSGGRQNESKMVRGKGRGHDSERTGKKEMNPDVLIRDGKAGWSGGQGKKAGRVAEWRSGRACVPDFWSRSMIFPKRTNEGGGLRMAAMELDLAGGRMANRVARSWKMRLCVLESHSLPRIILRVPLLIIPLYFSLSFFSVSPCLSTYARARDHVIPYDHIVSGCTGRSLSDSPRCD